VKVPGFFLAFSVLVLTIGTSSAEIYKWVDENGVVHFSDSPTEIITESNEEEEEEVASPDPRPEDNYPPTEETQNATLDANFFDLLDESREAPATVNAPTVEIYETSWCGYCKKAKRFFRSRGIEFSAYDIEKDKDAARRMTALTKRRAVPFVVINGHQIQGYSEQAYELALQN
jgi:glutaredoxin-like YruB-family protein